MGVVISMLGQRQEPERRAAGSVRTGDAPDSDLRAGAGRTPFDWQVDTLEFAEHWTWRQQLADAVAHAGGFKAW